MHDERIWVIDTEGNGEHPGEIIELALVEMVGLEITGRHHQWRFRPRTRVHYRATRVHGITNQDLRHCPRIERHVDEIRGILGTTAIAGHAVHVDLAALQRVLPGWEPCRAYDTLRIARRIFPDLERHRLSSVGDHLAVSDQAARLTKAKAHSAFYDAVLCGLVIRHGLHPYDPQQRSDLMVHAEILAFRRERERGNARKAEKAALRRAMSLERRGDG